MTCWCWVGKGLLLSAGLKSALRRWGQLCLLSLTSVALSWVCLMAVAKTQALQAAFYLYHPTGQSKLQGPAQSAEGDR